eukprot:4092455-Prymnesium_polylepis.1
MYKPSLRDLFLGSNRIADSGTDSLAAALDRGALPSLQWLMLCSNRINGSQFGPLAAQLRKRRALTHLDLNTNPSFGDDGAAALAANLTDGVFNRLTRLNLKSTGLGDGGCTTLAAAIDRGAFPVLEALFGEPVCGQRYASQAAIDSVRDALKRNARYRDLTKVL